VLYEAYVWQQRLTGPGRAASAYGARAVASLPAPLADLAGIRRFRAACQVMAVAHPTHVRPDWGIDSILVNGNVIDVEAQPAVSTPFATVLHFAKPDAQDQPRVLVVGPISGHFATLLRPTVRTLLTDHDVHVIDWNNARDIPVEAGRFGLDEYIDHILQALRHLGPDTHVIAVCQPAPLVLAAVSLLATTRDPVQPRSLTLVAGPVDTRISPNQINTVASRRPLSWYERFLTTAVPAEYAGAGRRVYPGVAQLTAFMSMNPRRHLSAHLDLYRALAAGDQATATRIRDFYDEYGAVMDVPAEFYLETLKHIFMDHDLPRGEFTWRGEQVDPAAIRETALLTVEGAQDDLCSPGQTEAAHRLCTSIPTESKRHHLQPGVGHYGVFAGARWESEIYPVIRVFIAEHHAVQRATSAL
jgi:poly(3-hydroxybutyrate) depolymerase